MNLNQYQSPPWESSLYKGIPIELYSPKLRAELRAVVGPGLYVKFRGPRPVDGRSQVARQGTCLQRYAKTVSVYQKYNSRKP